MKVDWFSGSCRQNVPRHEVPEAIERESSTIFLKKKSFLCLVQLFCEQTQEDCYNAKVRQQCSLGQ